MPEVFFNDFGTTLTTVIDATQTTFVVSSTSAYPNPYTSSTCRIRIDDEIMTVTAINFGTNTLTVTRAQETTTSANHASGAQVLHILTAGGLSAIVSQSNTSFVGTQASLPGSYSLVGSSYHATDQPYINVWNGSSYTQYYTPIVTPPPALGTWTVINGSQISTSTTTAGLNVTRTSGSNIAGLFVATPATPYKIAMRFHMVCASNDSNSWAGAYWSNNLASPTLGQMMVVRGNNNWINFNITSGFTGSPGFGTIYDPGASTMGMIGNQINMILEDNGTNRIVHTSADGVNFVVGSGWPRARTDNATPAAVGFGVSGTTLTSITLVSWRVF